MPRLLLAALLALSLMLAACGGDDDGGSETASASAARGSFPVTVAHKYGTTTVEEAPERVVTLGLSDQDVVLALGTKPVGAIDWFKERPYGDWAWVKRRWGGDRPEIVGERDEFNLERIAALRPDLILAQYSGMSEDQYEKLSQIAPTVGQPRGYDDYAAPWQAMALLAGKALGQERRTRRMIEAVADRFAAVRREHPEWSEQTAVVFEAYEPGKFAAFAPTDPKARFLAGLGFKYPAPLREAARSQNIVDLSSERARLLDADRLVVLTSSSADRPRLANDPVAGRLRAVREGGVLYLSYEQPPQLGAALSFNTVLSIPYAIDTVVELLERAR